MNARVAQIPRLDELVHSYVATGPSIVQTIDLQTTTFSERRIPGGLVELINCFLEPDVNRKTFEQAYFTFHRHVHPNLRP
jgi:hypothetical protein